ncbi:MAG TPA: dTDP-4-dehydrorhamnose 3,5-epimerase [Polyangiaceae bacterium]
MQITPTELPGVHVVGLERIEDERGFFARSFDGEAFRTRGLDSRVVQCSVSYNQRRGTLRGMHYQVAPHEESKLVRCTKGAIYDVALDLRPDSAGFRRWIARELSEENRLALYLPAGVAHGFQTLADDTEVFYQISEAYHPESARGVRFDDPAFGIRWPVEDPIVSERDRAFLDYAG